MAARHHALEVDVDRSQVRTERHVDEVTRRDDAGVVDEDIEAAEMPSSLADGGFKIAVAGNVAGQGQRLVANLGGNAFDVAR